MNEPFRDLRFAFRSLSRSPGFALIAIVTLGLGIGANTSMFSVLNEVHAAPGCPIPIAASWSASTAPRPQNPRGGVSPADYLDLKSAGDRLRRDRRLRRSRT